MKSKEKEKKMATKSTDNLTLSESTLRKEVGAQDNVSEAVPQGGMSDGQGAESNIGVLDHLANMVGNVADKLGTIEARLSKLEEESGRTLITDLPPCDHTVDPDKHVFTGLSQLGVRPKHRRLRQVMSDVEILELDNESKLHKKKKGEKKTGHSVKNIPLEYAQRLAKCADKTVIERRVKPT